MNNLYHQVCANTFWFFVVVFLSETINFRYVAQLIYLFAEQYSRIFKLRYSCLSFHFHHQQHYYPDSVSRRSDGGCDEIHDVGTRLLWYKRT